MVIHGLLGEWHARLAALRSQVAAGDAGPLWLWKIRIRILEYLVARYAGCEPLVPPRRESPTRSAPPAVWPAAAQPPRAIGALAPLLRDLAQANDERRACETRHADLEEAWTWWRSLMCR